MKYYFCDTIDEYDCFMKSYIRQYMKDEGIKQLHVFEAIPEYGSEYFYCKKYCEIGEKKEGGCGKICSDYAPRNGKSGCCKYIGLTYTHGNRLLLQDNGKINILT